MEERTCPTCGKRFIPTHHNQRYCPPGPKTGRGQPRSSCARKASNDAYRAGSEVVACKGCGAEFNRVRGRTRNVYCSAECHRDAKRSRYAIRCEHGLKPVKCPACSFLQRCERGRAWRKVVKADPCAYCGERPSGLDHIDPTVEDRNDPANWTGCCKRCNELKRRVPLLLALNWIPAAREYHAQRRMLFSSTRKDKAELQVGLG